MSPRPGPAGAAGFGRPELLFIAASIVWAAVMIDTGDIAWPLAVWVGTVLVPLSLSRQRRRDHRASTP